MKYVKILFTNIQKTRIISTLAYFLRNLQTSQANNSRVLGISCFYMNTDILEDFQICISVPLTDQILLSDCLYF